MKIHSYNEWDTLREVVVGSATKANWPSSDPVFAKECDKTTWKNTPPPAGPVPHWIIDETNEDLESLCVILRVAGVKVHRPRDIDFQDRGGMYNYCPRDRLLIAGTTVVDTAMMYPCRDMELEALHDVVDSADCYVHMPRNEGLVMDAANVCRMDDKWLFLESASGNRSATLWLSQQFPDIDIYGCNFYSGVHIDSTVVPLRDGLVMLNASRVAKNSLPSFLQSWDQIWVDDVVAQDFYQYPYASKWIGMNILSIDPTTVVIDAAQTGIITMLEQRKFTVIPHTLRHSRTLGGGFHCVTLDTWRENA